MKPSAFKLARVTRLDQLAEGSNSLKSDMDALFAEANSIVIENDTYRWDLRSYPLLNIPIEAGKTATLDYMVGVPAYEGTRSVEAVDFNLTAHFSNGLQQPIHVTSPTARTVPRSTCRG